MTSGRTGHWTKMHQSLVKFSESEASNHTPSLADFTTTTPELKFSVHTGQLSPSPARQQRTHSAALFEASQDRPLVNVSAQPKATTCRRSRLGKQDGTRGLGHHAQTGHLPTRSSGSMNC